MEVGGGGCSLGFDGTVYGIDCRESEVGWVEDWMLWLIVRLEAGVAHWPTPSAADSSCSGGVLHCGDSSGWMGLGLHPTGAPRKPACAACQLRLTDTRNSHLSICRHDSSVRPASLSDGWPESLEGRGGGGGSWYEAWWVLSPATRPQRSPGHVTLSSHPL